jgi:NAD-dependent protein deacetylase/lipoamidase
MTTQAHSGLDAAIAAAARARHIVAFTGAGVSTESGLPDFRSPGGIWSTIDPSKVATRSAALSAPTQFYEFYRARLEMLATAAPNPAHLALARWEHAGTLRSVVTQNVDSLHQQAGSRRVIELHGNLREAACLVCRRVFPVARIRESLDAGTLPECAACGGMLKPNVVLFGEVLPEAEWAAAMEAARQCDVVLVVGSSLLVTPAAYVVHEALQHGARLIIVNREATSLDGAAAAVLRGDAGRILPELVDAVIGTPASGEEGFRVAPN